MTCPHIVTSGEGTAYCTLAESSGQDLADLKRFLTELADEVERRNDWLGRSELVGRIRETAK